MSRATPPRPLSVPVVFPQLAPLARTATRLHPRHGSPSPHDSSIGGPLLWPATDPWPHCDGPHTPDGTPPTALEDARLRQITAGCPWPEAPVPMLPVAQLHTRDIPTLRPPTEADLLQVLWCPFDHPPGSKPETALFWRSTTTITDILATPPEPAAVHPGYVPEPCLLTPEEVTEYPNPMELSSELQQQLADWATWQTAGATVDSYYEPAPQEFYRNELSVAPGWKTAGWTRWGLTDPIRQTCPTCATEMAPLLTIATAEWDDTTRSWIPYEDQATADPDAAHPTRIEIAGGYDLQLYTCPNSPDHPHSVLIQ